MNPISSAPAADASLPQDVWSREEIALRAKQIDSTEQKIVLRALAENVAHSNCLFLEVGSWCGDSTAVLGKVAQKAGGHVVCVDWWLGNPGTELEDLANQTDVFSIFWNHICREGLQDTVIPIRSRSDLAANLLKASTFDLIFIDGDHRFETAQADIKNFKSLVRVNGILCGHDCEGRIEDYDRAFLESGKNCDVFESVHCGVVLAVGQALGQYDLTHSIWSTRLASGNNWICTGVNISGIEEKRQTDPSPLGFTSRHAIYRYGRKIYAVPRSNRQFRFDHLSENAQDGIISAESLSALKKIIHEQVASFTVPDYVYSYKGFNVMRYGSVYVAVSQTLGSIDVDQLQKNDFSSFEILEDSDLKNLESKIDRAVFNIKIPLLAETYRGYNLIQFAGRFYGLAKSLGTVELPSLIPNKIKQLRKNHLAAEANALPALKAEIDRMIPRQFKQRGLISLYNQWNWFRHRCNKFFGGKS